MRNSIYRNILSIKTTQMKISNAISYATKVWLFSVFLSPVILIFFSIAARDTTFLLADVIGGIGMFILYGGIFSIPCWLIFMLLVTLVSQRENSTAEKKGIINFLAILIGTAPFLLIFGIRELEVLAFAAPYLISLTIGIWYFELNQNKDYNAPSTIDHLIN